MDPTLPGKNAATERDLTVTILRWKKLLGWIALGVVGSYFVYFGLIVGLPKALDPDKWGAFGDFVGGIMNPIVAFAAFYWLTESVKLQKQELAETRAELKSAADAQQLLVRNGEQSIQLAALTALVNAVHEEMSLLQKRREEILSRVPDGMEDMYFNDHNPELARMHAKTTELRKSRDQYVEAMKLVLASKVANGSQLPRP